MFENRINIEGRSQKSFTYTATAGQSPVLEPGVYAVWSDVNCFIKVAPTANDVTIATGFPIFAGAPIMPVLVPDPAKIGAVGAGAGTLYFHQIN